MNFPIFPNLTGKWQAIDLDKEAQVSTAWENPLIQPEFCAKWVDILHKLKGIDYSFGGYFESRPNLWRGHYMYPDKCLHIGVDFNVPVGTFAAVPVDCKVLHVLRDKDQNGGWGTRIIFERISDRQIFLFAHLGEQINVVEGDAVKAGMVVGRVANVYFNGGWFPHLHVQCISTAVYATLDIIKQLDGYAAFVAPNSPAVLQLQQDYPNPLHELWNPLSVDD
jgi:hypothetical protein